MYQIVYPDELLDGTPVLRYHTLPATVFENKKYPTCKECGCKYVPVNGVCKKCGEGSKIASSLAQLKGEVLMGGGV